MLKSYNDDTHFEQEAVDLLALKPNLKCVNLPGLNMGRAQPYPALRCDKLQFGSNGISKRALSNLLCNISTGELVFEGQTLFLQSQTFAIPATVRKLVLKPSGVNLLGPGVLDLCGSTLHYLDLHGCHLAQDALVRCEVLEEARFTTNCAADSQARQDRYIEDVAALLGVKTVRFLTLKRRCYCCSLTWFTDPDVLRKSGLEVLTLDSREISNEKDRWVDYLKQHKPESFKRLDVLKRGTTTSETILMFE